MAEPEFKLHGLTKLDTRELGKSPGVRYEESTVPEGSHGEVTLFTAIFAMSALTALASYLLRKHNDQSFEETVDVSYPDGRREKRKIRWKSTSREAPEAEIVRQIRGDTF
jgi:hypothetical protein